MCEPQARGARWVLCGADSAPGGVFFSTPATFSVTSGLQAGSLDVILESTFSVVAPCPVGHQVPVTPSLKPPESSPLSLYDPTQLPGPSCPDQQTKAELRLCAPIEPLPFCRSPFNLEVVCSWSDFSAVYAHEGRNKVRVGNGADKSESPPG